MRGKAKQRVSLILVVTMVLGTALTGNTVFATGESSDEQDRIKINISKDSEQRACEKTKVFSCVLLFLDATVVIFYKKVYNSPYPIRKVIMESYAAVTAFFCLL